MLPVPWLGLSGQSYYYDPYDWASAWNDVPGNYIFALWDGTAWRAIYVGETESFADRMPSHDGWDGARLFWGATHVFARTNHGGLSARRVEERDLIRRYRPPLNKQHQPDEAEWQAALVAALVMPQGAPNSKGGLRAVMGRR